MKIIAVAFELAKENSDKVMTVSHRLMSSEYNYAMHVKASNEGFVLPFPSNVLVNSKEPAEMLDDVKTVCRELEVKLVRCITFKFDTEESVGIPAPH